MLQILSLRYFNASEFHLKKPKKLVGLWLYHLLSENLVNIGLGNCLLCDGAKSLPQPVLTYSQWRPAAVAWG